jgi:hypothetical protein
MARCPICGSTFDAAGYQVVLPGVEFGFDRLECADRHLAGAPLVWVSELDEGPDDLRAALLRPIRARWALPSALLLAAAVATVSLSLLSSPPAREGTPAVVEPSATERVPKPEGWLPAGASVRDGQPKRAPRRRERRQGSDGASLLVAAPALASSSAGDKPEGKAVEPASPPSSPPASEPSPPSSESSPSAEPAPPAAAPPIRPAARETRPGWGHGDRNHEHAGPPGKSSENGGKAKASGGR